MIAALLELHDLRAAFAWAQPFTEGDGSERAAAYRSFVRAGPGGGAPAPLHNDRMSRLASDAANRCQRRTIIIVDLATRRLSCSCRACWLLSGATGPASVRAVPERYLQGPALQFQSAQWEALQIPVSIAFFHDQQLDWADDRLLSEPGGRDGIGLTADRVARHRADKRLGAYARSRMSRPCSSGRAANADDECDGFIVPIDACYDLVGTNPSPLAWIQRRCGDSSRDGSIFHGDRCEEPSVPLRQ